MKSFLKVSTVLLFVTLAWSVHGQIALRGGVNYSNISIDGGDIVTETDSKSGLQGGIMLTMGLGEKLAFRPGAILSIKGYKLNNENIDITYLEIPASFLFYFASSRDGLYVELGPYVGAQLSNDLEDLGGDLKTLDFGANIGVGIELGRVGVGINYGYGLGNIIDGDVTTSAEAKNKNFGVFAYIEF